MRKRIGSRPLVERPGCERRLTGARGFGLTAEEERGVGAREVGVGSGGVGHGTALEDLVGLEQRLLGAAGGEQRAGPGRAELGTRLVVRRQLQRALEQLRRRVGLTCDERRGRPYEAGHSFAVARRRAEREVARDDRGIGGAVQQPRGFAVPPGAHRSGDVRVERFSDEIVAEREHVAGRLEQPSPSGLRHRVAGRGG